MESPRELYLRLKEESDKKQFDETINNPNLSSAELWTLTGDNFNEWRKKHDYPKLLKSFNDKIPSFVQWKEKYGITDEQIIECSVTDFVSPKKLSKDKSLYLLEQTFDGKKRLLVCYADLTGTTSSIPEHTESYKLLKKFISYSDWCTENKTTSNLFNITRRQASGYDSERVWLETGYELLKMGGITAPVNGFGLLIRGKHLEFVNMCGLKLEGRIYFGEEGNLSFSYCAIDNLFCEKLEMPSVDFEYSSIKDLQITDSEIHGWRFWECSTTGDIINSKLRSVNIFGGLFTPFYKDTTILDLDAEHKGHPHTNFSYTYSNLKKIYSDQGDETKATEYFIKERELYREFSKGWKFFVKSISYFYWGYGKKPERIIYIAIATIISCAFIYFLFPCLIAPTTTDKTLLDSIYFSTVTFTTLGYGDLSPIGGLRIVALLEAFFGALSIGFIVAGFSNTKY